MGDISENVTADTGEFVSAFEAAVEAAEELEERLDAVRSAISEADSAAAALTGIADALEADQSAAEGAAQAIGSARDKLAELAQAGEDVEAASLQLDQLEEAAEATAEALGQARDAEAELSTAAGEQAGNVEAAAAALAAASSSADTFAASEDDAAASVSELDRELHEQTESFFADAMAADSYAASVAAAAAGNQSLSDMIDSAEGNAQGLWGTLGRLRDELGGAALGDTFTVTSTGWNKFMVSAPQDLDETAAALESTGAAATVSAAQIQAAGIEADEAFLLGKAAADSYRDSLAELAGMLAAVDAEAAASLAELTAMGSEAGGGEGGGAFGALAGGIDAVSGALGSLGGVAGKLKIPAIVTGIMGLIGGFEPALMAVGSGFVSFAALSIPALEEVEKGWSAVNQARDTYLTAVGVEKRDPTSDNLKDEKTDLAALETAYARMPAAVRPVVRDIQGLAAAWRDTARSSGIEQDALRDVGLAFRTAEGFLPSLVTMARAAAPVISDIWTGLDRNVRSSDFKSFVASMAADVKPASQGFHELASAVGGWFATMSKRGGPESAEFLGQLSHMLKTITPASVTGFLDAAKLMGHAFNLISEFSSGPGRNAAKNIRDYVGGIEAAWRGAERAGHDYRAWTDDFWSGAERLLGMPGSRTARIAVKPQLDFSQPSYDAQSLKAALDKAGAAGAGGAGAKVTVPLDPRVAAPDLQKSLDNAAQDVKIHGATVDLADAKLSGLSALASTMSQAGKLAGTDMDRALASAITSGSAAAVGDARKMGTEIRAALAPVPGELHSIGVAAGEGMASGIAASTGAAVAAAEHMAAAVEAAARVKLQTQSPSKVFAKIGAETVAGFVAGLLGGEGQVRAALAAILGHAVNDLKIAQAVDKMRTEIDAALKAGVITAAQESEYTGWLREDNRRLQRLASERASLEKQIKAADALAASVRSEAVSEGSVTSAYGETWAGKAGAAQSPTYRTVNQALKAQLEQTREFRADIARLKKEGLDENSIRALLAEGVTAGLPQAEQLLASGRGGIRETAKLEKEIAEAAKRLGITGANASYESGKDIGRGLAEGLRSQLGEIEAEMRKIADELVAAIRRALRISSPSQVMREIGQMAAAGVVQGADDYQTLIRAAGGRMAAALWTHHPVAEPMGFGAGGGYAAPQPIIIDLTVVSELDGRVVSRSVQKFTLQRARRNISSGLVLRGRAA